MLAWYGRQSIDWVQMVQMENGEIIGPKIFDVKIENCAPVESSRAYETDCLEKELNFDNLNACYETL